MSIGGILESLQQSLGGGPERSLAFRADADFGSTLTLGQIIKGKVMRHYEGGRYGIDFGGNEKVVDATFPLKNGEVISARVIGIDEKVHLQRVLGAHDRSPGTETAKRNLPEQYGADAWGDPVRELFDKYQARLSSEEHQLLLKLQNTLGGPRRVAVGALILSKLGVALDPALIKAVHRALADPAADSGRISDPLPAHTISGRSGNTTEDLIAGLAALLSRISDKGPTPPPHESVLVNAGGPDGGPTAAEDFPAGGHGGEDGSRDQLEWFLGQWLLNAQTGGAVAHRLLRIPLWFGGQLREVTLALFAQKETGEDGHQGREEKLRYRNAVFTLDTPSLGPLQIEARLADRHVRIAFGAERTEAAEYLGSHAALLTSALAACGWQVDDIRYSAGSGPGGPLQAVIEHYINEGSLNRLL
jgi:hypothetical protein